MDESSREKAEQLYTKYSGLMYHIAHKYTHSNEQLDDAVHEAFSRILLHLDKIGDLEAKETRNFIGIVTRNTTINFLKGQHSERHIPLLDDDSHAQGLLVEFDFDHILVDDILRFIRESLHLLKKEYADILLLKMKFDYSNKELAELLGISETNTKVRLSRARASLRKELEKRNQLKELDQ